MASSQKGVPNPKNATHGMTNTPEYRTWSSIRARCNNKNTKSYKYYGGRGIKLSEEWNSFENFYADMGKKPSSKHEIDRVDTDGNYSKENCRWVTREVNANNKRSNAVAIVDGERKTMAQLARETGVSVWSLYQRRRISTDKDFLLLPKDRKRTHCTHGHEFTTENTRIITSKRDPPYKQCKICYPKKNQPLPKN